ncbi:MAG: ATP-binding protein [Mycobacterium sp.]
MPTSSQPSPYTPGELAQALPGRDPQMLAILERLAYLGYKRSLVGRIRVFMGPRGVGKTSLLRRAQQEAERQRFATIWVTTGDERPLAAALADEFARLSRNWKTATGTALKAALKTLKVSIAGVSIGVGATEDDPVPVGTGRALQDAIESAVNGVLDHDASGLIIFIDEVQSADAVGLKALAYAWQHLQAQPDGIPAIVIAAGLSHSQDVIAKAVSFGERFEYIPITNLDPDAARYALTEPAREAGVDWAPDALEAVLAQTQGYPYFIQEFGDTMWSAAGYPAPGSTLTLTHFHEAHAAFRQSRDQMFRSRWVQTTPAEAKMLVAMAAVGDTAIQRKDIAAGMDVGTTAISMVRRSLMDKGLIEPSGHGKLRFTAPGFGAFIREYADLE